MRLDANKLFMATSATFAVAWIICAAFVALTPSGMMGLTGHMMHTNTGSMTWSLSFTGLFAGLIAWSVLSGAIAWLIATIYNKLVGGA